MQVARWKCGFILQFLASQHVLRILVADLDAAKFQRRMRQRAQQLLVGVRCQRRFRANHHFADACGPVDHVQDLVELVRKSDSLIAIGNDQRTALFLGVGAKCQCVNAPPEGILGLGFDFGMGFLNASR